MPWRVDFPLKPCAVCGETMRRKRYGRDRRMEGPAQYARRRTCGPRCHAILAAREQGQLFREMTAEAPAPDLETGQRLAPCSRCATPCALWPRQTRCNHCRGATGRRVTFVRGRI